MNFLTLMNHLLEIKAAHPDLQWTVNEYGQMKITFHLSDQNADLFTQGRELFS